MSAVDTPAEHLLADAGLFHRTAAQPIASDPNASQRRRDFCHTPKSAERGRPMRQRAGDAGPQVREEHLYKVIETLEAVAVETGRTVTQVALHRLFCRPSVSTPVIGTRNEEQLRLNPVAVGWSLPPGQEKALDDASAVPLSYSY